MFNLMAQSAILISIKVLEVLWANKSLTSLYYLNTIVGLSNKANNFNRGSIFLSHQIISSGLATNCLSFAPKRLM